MKGQDRKKDEDLRHHPHLHPHHHLPPLLTSKIWRTMMTHSECFISWYKRIKEQKYIEKEICDQFMNQEWVISWDKTIDHTVSLKNSNANNGSESAEKLKWKNKQWRKNRVATSTDKAMHWCMHDAYKYDVCKHDVCKYDVCQYDVWW